MVININYISPREFYDNDAENYDREHNTPYYNHVRWFERKFMKYLEEPILDIGTGTGYMLRGMKYVGVDISIEMLKRNPGIVLQGNAEELPFPDESFPSVTSLLISLAFTNIEKSFSEIFRVLKPRGRAVVTLPTGDKRSFRHKKMKLRFNTVPRDFVPQGFKILKKKELFFLVKPKWRSFKSNLLDWTGMFLEKFINGKGEVMVLLIEKI